MRAARAAPRAIAVAALALIALLVGCAAAPGSLVLDDETGSLERAALEAAAAPLLARGARVVVIVAARGDEAGADLARRLDAAGLLEGGQVAPDALVLYVSYAPRYSELRAGTRWSRRLPATALREARTTLLNPALRDDQLVGGVAATLQALEARIASPPLSERLQTGLSALAMAGGALAVLALSPLGEWLGHRWRRTPPGRLTRWLGDQTPPGRRRLGRIIRTTRLRMEDRATFARSWCKAAASGPQGVEAAALMARLRALDQERAALSTGARQDRALEEALDRLARAYEALGHDASRLAPARPRPKAGGKKAAGSAFTAAPATTSGAIDPSPSDSPSTGDSGGSSDSGPSSDGGSW
jgi:uncharacterized membrane protein YgcG